MLGNKCQIFSLQARVRALVFALFSKNLTSGPGLWLLLPIEIISGSGKVGLSNKQMCCFFQLVVRPKKFGYFNFTAAEVEYRDNEDITVSEKRTALSSEPGQGLIIALKDYERQFSAHTVKSAKPCHSRPSQVKIWEVVVAQMVQLSSCTLRVDGCMSFLRRSFLWKPVLQTKFSLRGLFATPTWQPNPSATTSSVARRSSKINQDQFNLF